MSIRPVYLRWHFILAFSHLYFKSGSLSFVLEGHRPFFRLAVESLEIYIDSSFPISCRFLDQKRSIVATYDLDTRSRSHSANHDLTMASLYHVTLLSTLSAVRQLRFRPLVITVQPMHPAVNKPSSCR